MDAVAFLDTLLSPLPALWRVIGWGALGAAISMGIYAALSPQQKMHGLKQQQKKARRMLLDHDGDFKELRALIQQDLALSLRLIGLAVLPFLLSLLPLIAIVVPLLDIYAAPLVSFGPEWMQSFEFWYIGALIAASLVIKILFRIA